MNTPHRPLALLASFALSGIAAHLALAQPDCLQQRLIGDQDLGGSFGRKMTMSDRHLIIGNGAASVPCPGAGPICSGAIYVYERHGGALFLTQTIIPWDITHEGFGVSVSIDPLDPNRMMTASAGRIHEGVWGVGYLYEFDGEEWRETSRFYPPPGAPVASDFARFIVLRGDTALVTHGGSRLYHYREVAGQWEFVERIFKPDVMEPESVSFTSGGIELGDDWAFVTAYRDKSQGPLHGAVAAYRRETDGTLTFVQHLLPPADVSGERQGEQFGRTLAFDGHTLAVSSYADREFLNQGVVYVFELEGEQWALQQEIHSSDAARGHRFGGGLSVEGDAMVVGRNDTSDTRLRSYLFTRGADGVWRESAILTPGDVAPALPIGFGYTSTMHGRWAVVGAQHEIQTGEPRWGPGAAYIYDLDCLTEGCPVDLDGDDQLTIFDFLMFQNLFDAGDMQADFDGDGELTIFDFLAFQTAFDAGCE